MTAPKPVFGPNDFNMMGGVLTPGLGPDEEKAIREARGGYIIPDEPPAKAALRAEHEKLKAKAQQLSLVERELEKEKEDHRKDLERREAELAEREALVAAQLKDLEKAGAK